MCPGMVLVQRVTGRTRNTARGWYDTRRTASVETAVPRRFMGKGDVIFMMGESERRGVSLTGLETG